MPSKSEEIWEQELAGKARGTQANYRLAFQRFLEYMKTDAEGLFQTQLAARKSPDPRDVGSVVRAVRAYMQKQVEAGLSPSHVQQTYKAVRLFMRANGLEEFTLKGPRMPMHYQGQKIVDAEQIRALLACTGTPSIRALVLAAKDSGLRISDLAQLKAGPFRLALQAGKDFILIPVEQVKTGAMAKPCFGPETIQAVRKMLGARPDLRDEDPLFVKLHGRGVGSRRMQSDAISAIFRRLAWKAGFQDVSAHSLRKFNTTYLSAAKMPEAWLSILQGKSIPGTWGPYMQPSDQQLLDAYREAYPKLMVLGSEPVDEEARAEVQKLRRQVTELEKFRVEAEPAVAEFQERERRRKTQRRREEG